LDKYLSPIAHNYSLLWSGNPERKPASTLSSCPHTPDLCPRIASKDSAWRITASELLLADLPALARTGHRARAHGRSDNLPGIQLASPLGCLWLWLRQEERSGKEEVEDPSASYLACSVGPCDRNASAKMRRNLLLRDQSSSPKRERRGHQLRLRELGHKYSTVAGSSLPAQQLCPVELVLCSLLGASSCNLCDSCPRAHRILAGNKSRIERPDTGGEDGGRNLG